MENFKYFYRNQPLEFNQFLPMTGAEQISLHLQEQQEGKLRNYRLVNLTLVPRKVMEKIVLESISKCMKDNNVIGNCQHGFTNGEILIHQPNSLLQCHTLPLYVGIPFGTPCSSIQASCHFCLISYSLGLSFPEYPSLLDPSSLWGHIP